MRIFRIFIFLIGYSAAMGATAHAVPGEKPICMTIKRTGIFEASDINVRTLTGLTPENFHKDEKYFLVAGEVVSVGNSAILGQKDATIFVNNRDPNFEDNMRQISLGYRPNLLLCLNRWLLNDDFYRPLNKESNSMTSGRLWFVIGSDEYLGTSLSHSKK